MQSIVFEVLGNPQALKRHRTFKRGNFTGTYDPSKTEKQDFLCKVQEKAPEKPFDCPITVVMYFGFARPKSHYGTGRNASKLKSSAPIGHISRPDIDNLIKFVCDALNGVFWKDDSCICNLSAAKVYDEQPKTKIHILPVRSLHSRPQRQSDLDCG